jgi:hypothetical protein
MEDIMETQTMAVNPRNPLPAEYWETGGSIHGALVSNVSGDGVLIKSVRDIPLGDNVHLRVFYANGYELDVIELTAKMTWRRASIERDWEGFLYGLEFVEISSKDHEDLVKLLNHQLPSEGMSEERDIVCKNHSSEKDGSSLSSSVLSLSNSKAENGRDKKKVFCNLRETAVDTANRTQESRNHGSSSLTSALAKIAGNFMSTVRGYWN